MAERHDVVIKVISQKGTCEAGHKVGDEWVIKDIKTPEGICLTAFGCLYPNALSLIVGGEFPWESDPDISRVACPDPYNPVVFELRRLRE